MKRKVYFGLKHGDRELGLEEAPGVRIACLYQIEIACECDPCHPGADAFACPAPVRRRVPLTSIVVATSDGRGIGSTRSIDDEVSLAAALAEVLSYQLADEQWESA